MAVCSAKNCYYHDANNGATSMMDGITYHLFPKNAALRARWINQMNDETFVPHAQSMLCSQHFIREYFITDARGVAYLKPDAIPTEFEFEFDNSAAQDDGAISCCAYRCTNNSNTGPPITLHQFPVEQPELCDQWLLAMNIAQVEADKAVLCSDHFDEEWFVVGDDGERHLMANAVPSIFQFPEGEEFENDEGATGGGVEYFSEVEETKPKSMFSESTLLAMQKHDDLVRSVLEEESRLQQIRTKRIKLETKKKDLEFLISVVLRGGAIDRETYDRLKPLIAEVDSHIHAIVTDCLGPCIPSATVVDEEA